MTWRLLRGPDRLSRPVSCVAYAMHEHLMGFLVANGAVSVYGYLLSTLSGLVDSTFNLILRNEKEVRCI